MASSFAGSSEKVKTISVDTLLNDLKISELNFIKIDIEGYEYFAFKGAEKTLRHANAPDILFEFLDCAETTGVVFVMDRSGADDDHRLGLSARRHQAYGLIE